MSAWSRLRKALPPLQPWPLLEGLGRWALGWWATGREFLAFAVIVATSMAIRLRRMEILTHTLTAQWILRAGVQLLPLTSLLAVALGFVVVGQTVALLSGVGAQELVGTIMVTVVVRELGPLVTVLAVLLRTGTATIIQLGTARASGEVEALEALGIDPIHYLVIPRFLGTVTAVLSVTVYLILGAVVSGYGFIVLQDLPLQPGEYFRQVALAFVWPDFVLLVAKALLFGVVIGLVSCFAGLARPLAIEEVPSATTRGLAAALVGCVTLDILFIGAYLALTSRSP